MNGPSQPADPVVAALQERVGEGNVTLQESCDGITTVWLPLAQLHDALGYLKTESPVPYEMFFDVTAVDERERARR